MSAVIVDMYRSSAPQESHEMEVDDGDSKALPAALHASISTEDVNSFLAKNLDLSDGRSVSEPPKPKRTSRTYQFSDRDIRRYQQARKEGRLRFPDLFMYHIQRPTDDVQREAKMVKKIDEQHEAERISAQVAAAAASNALLEAVLADQRGPVKISGNAGNSVTFEQHSAHHCDESMALKSEHDMAGKKAAEAAASESKLMTSDDESSKNKKKRKFKFGRFIVESKKGSVITKKVIPVLVIAAAGFAGVMIVTSSVGIGLAVAIPCAAITYGSIKLYEHCKNKKRITGSAVGKKHSASGAAAVESAPLAKVAIDH